MTVSELISALADHPPGCEVIVWLPGSRITLGPVMNFLSKDGKVMIEGNVTAKSVLAGGPGEK